MNADSGRSGIGVASILTLGQVATAGSAFVVNLLSASALAPSERGILALLLQFTYLGAVLVVLGTERPFMAHLSPRSFGEALGLFIRLISPGFAFAVIPVLLAVAALLMGQPWWAVAFVAMSTYMVFNAIGKGVRVGAIATDTLSAYAWFVGLTQGSMIVAAVVLAKSGTSDALAWYLAYAGSGATVLLVGALMRITFRRGSLPQDTFSSVRREGLRLLPASFGNTAMLRSDRLILPLFAGTAQLGIYVTVATVMEMVTWPVNQWVDSSLRRWSKAEREGDGQPLRVVRITAYVTVFAVVSSAAIGLLAYLAITHLLPKDYRPAVGLILPLAIASVVYAVSRVQQGILIARGWTGTVSIVEMIGMLASVAGYLALIPMWGALGAAYGSIGGYAVAAIVAATYVRKSRRETLDPK